MSVYDLVYAAGLLASAPIWLAAPRLRRKVLDAIFSRTGDAPARQGNEPAVLIHAVSLGEINATTALVRMLGQAGPDLRFIITTTSRTGSQRAVSLYGNDPRITLIRYPFDFSGPVARLLDAQRPALAVLMELEVWPNFMRECVRRDIPVVLINGRLSAHSFRRYKLAGLVTRRMFKRLALACVQEETYARRFIGVGVPAEKVRVTGTMKFDTAQIADTIEGAAQIADAVGLHPGTEKLWVCGSTGPGEEQILLDVYSELLPRHPTLRLVVVPRHPERFEEMANLIGSRGFACVRRSQTPDRRSGGSGAEPTGERDFPGSFGRSVGQASLPVILGDTMGELRKFYSLADIVFVGRTLVDLGPKQHGSDMIEPAALGKPVLIGPFTGNFADVMSRFRDAGAIREVSGKAALIEAMEQLLASPTKAADMATRARQVVRQNQGATAAHVEIILGWIAGLT
ncbi:MAG TPA: 3-deoxy-D-manno-octulosonic acid transferase [Tepidisphaeraceae bacterium]|nr:3-deoxy-D-manno-octulosonic acid transferase [Tepidisphaeraceae bacterium]